MAFLIQSPKLKDQFKGAARATDVKSKGFQTSPGRFTPSSDAPARTNGIRLDVPT